MKETRNIEGVRNEGRIVEGYAIVFNKESNNLGGFTEVILPEAVTNELLERSDVKVYLNHDHDRGILARSKKGKGSLNYELRDDGVTYRFESPNTALGDEVVEGLKRGDYDSSSFAMIVEKDSWTKRSDGSYLRTIKEIRSLHDFSIVADPAYNEAYVKVAQRSLDEFKKSEIPEDIEAITEVTEEVIVEEPVIVEELKDEERNLNNKNNKIMKFSLLKTINDQANNRPLDERAMEVINQGIAEMRNAGLSYSGQIVLPVEERGDIAVGGDGGVAVAEDKLNIMGPLYQNLVFTKAGAQFMTGLVGDLSLPKYSGSNVLWKGEVEAAEDGAGAFDEVTLAPKRLTAYLDVSKQFLIQDSVSAEALLRADIVRALQNKLEATILGAEAGSATKPAGLFHGITASGVASFAKVVDMETQLEEANVGGNKKFIVAPSTKATFKTTQKGAGIGMIQEGNEVNGYETISTSAMPKNSAILGDFSDLVIAQWGGIEVVTDPFTLAKEGKVRIVINGYFDVKARRNESFVPVIFAPTVK